MNTIRRALVAVIMMSCLVGCASPPHNNALRISETEIRDRVLGGLLGQLFGNLNGLPYEFKFMNEPGDVAPGSYTPGLPDGARTDDDTDIEWVYICAMQKRNELFLQPAEITDLWKQHISERIWCANRYARGLMELGIEAPLTGRVQLNPWSDFNISGQFVSECFGLIAPGMPQTAARIGLHYTSVTIDGEPAQTTQLFTTMIATAFTEDNVQRIIDAGLAAIDPGSETAEVVQDVRRWWRENPDHWRTTRQLLRDTHTKHGGGRRDNNGYALNTGCIIAALLYGEGDLVETLRYAFNFGWDADCNAATAGTIIGVTWGAQRMYDAGWTIKDVYRNIQPKNNRPGRPGMPMDETISRFADRMVALGTLALEQIGGTIETNGGENVWNIPAEAPANILPISNPVERMDDLHKTLLPDIERNLIGSPQDRARAAYLAICLDEAGQLAQAQPEAWNNAVQTLQGYQRTVRNIFDAPPPHGIPLIEKAETAGLTKPEKDWQRLSH
jgi:hypothetical protein